MLVRGTSWRHHRLPEFLPRIGRLATADGRYKCAGTYDTDEKALSVAREAGKRATRTVKEYAPIFMRHHRVEGNTKDTYADTLRLHVIPFLGGCRLAETDRTVARNYFTALEEGGRSANTIRQAKVVLTAMFSMAVSDGYPDFNPFHDVKTPKVPGQRAIKIATTDQYLLLRSRTGSASRPRSWPGSTCFAPVAPRLRPTGRTSRSLRGGPGHDGPLRRRGP